LLVAVLRAFLVVAAVQLSGAAHFASDFVEVLATGHHHDVGGTDENDPDHDCPPGCPNCHHAHPSGASLPASAAPTIACPLADGRAAEPLGADGAPPGPQLPSIYRPPRA
jgi:hypothetical protein